MSDNELTGKVIGCAIEVHRYLGPGLLESAYQRCLAHELTLAGVVYRREQPMPVAYKTVQFDCGYRVDFLLEDRLILELKSVDRLAPIHEAQVLTYMKLANISVGLLINFNVRFLKNGIQRLSL